MDAQGDPRQYVRFEMKDKDYTATACGFEFENGVAYAYVNLGDGTVDRVGVDNVMKIFTGTSYRILADDDPEMDKAKLASSSKADRELAKKEERMRAEIRAELEAELEEKAEKEVADGGTPETEEEEEGEDEGDEEGDEEKE